MGYKITCIDSKNYKLTKDREYEVLNETKNLYEIENDLGARVHYYKELFIKNNVKIKEDEAPAIKEKKFLTDEEILSNLDITEDDYDDSLLISVTTDIGKVSIHNNLQGYESQVSCGVLEISDLQDQMNEIYKLFPGEDRQTLCAKIFNKILNANIECFLSGKFIILSTNTNYTYFNALNQAIIMNNVVSKVKGINPNSQNEIVLWTIEI